MRIVGNQQLTPEPGYVFSGSSIEWENVLVLRPRSGQGGRLEHIIYIIGSNDTVDNQPHSARIGKSG